MLVGSASSQDSIGNIPPSDYTPPGSISSRNSIPRADSDEFPAPPQDSMAFHGHSSGSFAPVTPPPDLTRQAFASTDSRGSRVMHLSSVRTIENDDGQLSGKVTCNYSAKYSIWGPWDNRSVFRRRKILKSLWVKIHGSTINRWKLFETVWTYLTSQETVLKFMNVTGPFAENLRNFCFQKQLWLDSKCPCSSGRSVGSLEILWTIITLK